MKGLIFREFQNFLELNWSISVVDHVLDQPSLSTQGAYTSIGNYPHQDFISLAVAASTYTDMPLDEMIQNFGKHLFGALAQAHSDMVAGFGDCFSLIANIESVIHRDVRKIYKTDELPRFEILEHRSDDFLSLEYSSSRPFAILAEGLMRGALLHYGINESVSLIREDITNDGTRARFTLQKIDEQAELPDSG
ncbi:MAG: heme NO-binding domain-containing protein [Aquisalinus sp.]|nr:heme NO-binding domain-containing protein [Aquisalinus sp.]